MNSIFAYDKRTNELKGVNLDLVAGIVASYVGATHARRMIL